jgi:hypothetical protein
MPRLTYVERSARFDAVLRSAKARSDADQALLALLADPARDWLERIEIVAALGDVRGPRGVRCPGFATRSSGHGPGR